MKKYEAQSKLPFDIKKGDILTVVNGKLTKENGEVVPFDPEKETSFFKLIKEIKPIFENDTEVILKTPAKNPNIYTEGKYTRGSSITIPAYTPLKIVGSVERHKAIYAIVDFNGYKYEIKEDGLIAYLPYFFINSKGEVHIAIKGREEYVDNYRAKVKNYYNTRDEADKVLYSIIGEPKPVKVKKSKTKAKKSVMA